MGTRTAWGAAGGGARAALGLVALLAVACGGGEPPAAGRLEVSAVRLAFGQVPLGRSQTRAVTARNVGPGPLEVAALEVGPDAFALLTEPFLLEAGAARDVRVRFAPRASGALEGTLRLSPRGGSPVQVTLVGAGACPLGQCEPRPDGGLPDASGSDRDASAAVDATGAVDARVPDASAPDASVDASVRDAGSIDASVDAGSIDASVDAGAPDAGPMLTPGLAARWRFEEAAGPVRDDGGRGLDGAASGSGLARAVPGAVGLALRFVGGGRVTIPSSPALDFSSAASVTFWVSLGRDNQVAAVLARGVNLAADAVLVSTGCNDLSVTFSAAGGALAGVATACDALIPGVFAHVAAVNAGGQLSLYVDGQLVATELGGALGPIGSPLVLGQTEDGLLSFDGSLDELAWWTRALGPAEVCAEAGRTFARGSCL
jgi:hypothetical protein